MKKPIKITLALCIPSALLLFALVFFLSFQRPYRATVEGSGLDPALVYAMIKTESGFRENAESEAGAVGLMQLLPCTAEYICRLNGIPFERERLTEGEYNIRLGCRYFAYLSEQFGEETALAAYNAGEGTVREWLKRKDCSDDGIALKSIPYPETARYLKKVEKFRKIYRIFYHL